MCFENVPVLILCLLFYCAVPVCPHAGGVGLCELVQHYSMFDYIRVSGSLDNRMTEFADHLHEHMCAPVNVQDAHYMPPQVSAALPMIMNTLQYNTVNTIQYNVLVSKKTNR